MNWEYKKIKLECCLNFYRNSPLKVHALAHEDNTEGTHTVLWTENLINKCSAINEVHLIILGWHHVISDVFNASLPSGTPMLLNDIYLV